MAEKKTGLGRGFGGGLNSMFPQKFAKTKADADENKTINKEETQENAVSSIYNGIEDKAPNDNHVRKTKQARKSSGSGTEKTSDTASENSGVVYVKLREVEPNREQPRKVFEETALEELAGSIKQYGVIQPLIVTKRDDYYEIVAGERRWRAARMAGLKEIPVIIREYTEQEIVEIALIENIQREDLNPIEEAKAYQRLINEFHMKQEELASRVSKSRTAITNSMRLLKLASKVQDMLVEERITQGHARALLSLENPLMQEELAQQIEKEHMSVRDIEKLVQKLQKKKTLTVKEKQPEKTYDDYIYHDMEERMKAALGTKVSLTHNEKRGKIEIEYYSREELERVYELLCSVMEG